MRLAPASIPTPDGEGRHMRNESVGAAAALVGRLLLGSLFLIEGWSKLKGYGAAAAYMERFSVPGLLLPAVIAIELGAGLLLVVGWQARCAALALAIFCVVAALMFHLNFADRNQVLHFEKDLAIAGGLLVLAAFGPGRFSIEGTRRAKG
jgi:putative oxidoreductase